MQKKFIFNLGLLVFLNLLVKPFYILGIDTEILERVGQSEYGLYFALINLTFLLNIFMDMGIVNYNTSNIAKHHQLVSKHFSGIFSIRLLLAVIYLIICLLSAFVLGYGTIEYKLLIPLCLNQVLAGFILYIRSNLAGLQKFAKDSLISVLDRLILIIACSAVLWGNVFGLEISISLFIYLQTCSYGLTLIVALLTLKPHLSELTFKFNKLFNLAVLKRSFPYALLALLMGFYYRTDGIMLERMLDNGAYEAGIYAQAYRFFEAGNMLAYLFGALLFPMFSKAIGDKEQISALLNLAFRIILVGSVIAGIACFVFSSEIMGLRFSTEIETSAKAFKYLMIGFMGICGTYVFGALLTANENLKALNIMAVCGVLINVVLNLILIPSMKSEGAAIASMVTQISMALAQIYLVKFKMDISPGSTTYLRLGIFVALSILIIFPIQSTQVNWIMKMLAFSTMAFVMSFVTGVLSFRKLIQYFSLIRSLKA